MAEGSLVPALDRALQLLRELATTGKPQTLSELASSIGVSRSSVFNILNTLQQHGMVEKDVRHKTYRLGVAIFELGSAYLNNVSLVPAFNIVAQQLVEQCQETVKLAVIEGRDVVYLGKQEGLYSVRLVARVGSRVPAHGTAVGKVLLAQLSDDQIMNLYESYQFAVCTPNTIHTLEELLSQIQHARTYGFAYDREEAAIGLTCVAAPIRDHSREVVAAMSIGVPNDRLTWNRLDELRDMVVQAARELSLTLGARE
ncbi:MAG: IclR family transcriptional regulator [Roseiflexaceae bacterium]|nr:IclR family transcriptional regulator [Roseiflexaceae bacterium]